MLELPMRPESQDRHPCDASDRAARPLLSTSAPNHVETKLRRESCSGVNEKLTGTFEGRSNFDQVVRLQFQQRQILMLRCRSESNLLIFVSRCGFYGSCFERAHRAIPSIESGILPQKF
jgi:hypothetical protein